MKTPSMSPSFFVALVGLCLCCVPAGAKAGKVNRSHPPKVGPAPRFAVPKLQTTTLDNGIVLAFVPRPGTGLLDVEVQLQVGAIDEPAGQDGVASVTASLLTDGAAGKDALAFADAVDFIGAGLDASSAISTSDVSLHIPVARAQNGLDLVADVVTEPNFALADLKRLKKRRATYFLQLRDSPGALASIVRARSIYGADHRYGRPISGSPQSIAKMRLDDVKSFFARYYRPERAVIFAAGDTSLVQLKTLLNARLGKWKGKGENPPLAKVSAPKALSGQKILLVNKPGAAQSVLAAAALAPSGLSPLAPPVAVLRTLLGGSFASRLNQNLREEHGYAYGASAQFFYPKSVRAFLASTQVQTDATAPALLEVLKELKRIRIPAKRSEIHRARNYLRLTYPSRFETGRQVVGYFAWAHASGVPVKDIIGYSAKIAKVRAKAVANAAKKNIRYEEMRFIVVGDAQKVRAPLEALGLGPVEVIEANAVLPLNN